MTKRDFFIVIIKLFGLYSILISLFSILPSSISYLSFGEIDLQAILLITLSITIPVLLLVFLIFKADKVVSLLKLDNGFDDEKIYFERFNSENIIKLAIIIIAGFLLIENIANFIVHTLNAFKFDVIGSKYDSFDKIFWYKSGANIILSVLLLTNFKRLSKILNRKIEE